jgi:hypothetical protein
MGHEHVTNLEQDPPPAFEERVGKPKRPDGQRTRHPGYDTETSEMKPKDTTRKKNAEGVRVTWADVVRGTNRPAPKTPAE